MALLVTIIGIGKKHTGKYLVKVGDEVLLQKEPDNEFDEDAIKVLFNGEQVGYIGNSDLTVSAGCHSATQIQAFFDKEIRAKINGETTVKFKNSSGGFRESKAYVAELLPIMKKVEEDKMNKKVMDFKLVGSEVIYAGKSKLRQAIKDGKKPIIKLEISGDKIVGIFENELCGYIEKKKEKELFSADDIKPFIGESSMATITGQVGTNFIGSFNIDEKQLEKEQSAKDLKGVIQYLIENGLDTEENIKEKLAYLKKCKVSEKASLNLFKSYVQYPEEVKARIPKRPKTLYQDSQGIVKKCIGYINVRRNLLFEGDRGVGKNVLTETLAWLYNRPLYEFSLNSQHDNNSLLGGKTFKEATDESKEEALGFAKAFLGFAKKGFGLKSKDVDEKEADLFSRLFKKLISYFTGKKLIFEKSVIVEASEYGGILVFDEFNTSLGHVLSLFNSLLDDRRRISIHGYGTVDAHENFMAIATQNRDYQGTFDNNEATVDRFVPIIFPTLESIEEILLAKIPSISYDTVRICQTLYKGLKKAVVDGTIDEKALTIRGFIDACLVVEQDVPLKEALIDNIANKAQSEDERGAIRHMIDIQVL